LLNGTNIEARVIDASEFACVREAFQRDGFAHLPAMLSTATASVLAQRVHQIMHGDSSLPRHDFFFQHDSDTGRYEDLKFTQGFVGPSDAYRKIEKLERDVLLRQWIEHPNLAPLVKELCPDRDGVALYRAVAWNKAPRGGTELPWHQDGGLFWGLDKSPTLQIWLALDDAPLDAGCLQVVPTSHLGGLATPQGGTIPDEVSTQRLAESILLPARAGDVYLLHNFLWHRSGRNQTDQRRLAMSVSYLPGDTKCTRRKRAPRQFEKLFVGA
jgi:phytanoyl-CoA hydroxylase